ncbi:MAG: hypothetical protein PWQ88_808 [Candidatus Methanomethylophilaceae archaeon]|jgi:putative methanogenesis marker protein 8|nr:hypothetical protein [Candidatus Methanomethylophilaceae archaeon]
MGRHVMEVMGKTRVVVEEGKVVEVGEPLIEYCPLFKRHRGIERIDSGVVRDNIEFRIRDFGLCTPERQMYMDDFLSFGVSELLSLAVKEGSLDAAVIVSDGIGTCVIDDPRMIQGLGGRVSGIVSVEVFPEMLEKLGHGRSLNGEINQVKGVELAFSLGYERVGVSIVDGNEAETLRKQFGDKVLIFAVHTTGVSEQCAEQLFDYCDVVTACASKYVREKGSERALLQVGDHVPIFAASERGKELIERKLQELGRKPSSGGGEDIPRPLI